LRLHPAIPPIFTKLTANTLYVMLSAADTFLTNQTICLNWASLNWISMASQPETRVLLEVKHLTKHFPFGSVLSRNKGVVAAVDDVSFSVNAGETLGLVGESGCGKTTTGQLVVRLLNPTAGEVWFDAPDGARIDVARANRREIKQLRRHMQLIFQDPYSSLNPRMTLLEIIGEPLLVNGMAKGRDLRDRVAEILQVVGLAPDYMNRYPHAFSGGQRQRICIGRTLILRPSFIVCDEPVSALDVSIQAQILNLLKDLQGQFGLTYLFIAHNLSVVRHISDRVAVMYVGKIVEMAQTDELFRNPKHPYTEALLSAVPEPNPFVPMTPVLLTGEVADAANPPSGCYFHPRCRYRIERCVVETPALRAINSAHSVEHLVSCHRADELTLSGVAD
jgi:peptide/nickel transport system ATP-binding protein